MCQCPQRASIHFYDITGKTKADIFRDVSMPSTGFHSFLQQIPSIMDLLEALCQCPQRASIHFYRAKRGTIVLNKRVNALNGLPFISTKNRPSADDWRRECQCPQRASIHFYHNHYDCINYRIIVSMPSTGFHSFLPQAKTFMEQDSVCVNALNGLPFISTPQ